MMSEIKERLKKGSVFYTNWLNCSKLFEFCRKRQTINYRVRFAKGRGYINNQ
ncbi:MAG: hypothetical protein JSU61_04210 [Fidelibacterota bacterium]|nr:MAG: hypothetical protein JSU61_04210 [Candidatus Neomarinimicrobiota bacterium]